MNGALKLLSDRPWPARALAGLEGQLDTMQAWFESRGEELRKLDFDLRYGDARSKTVLLRRRAGILAAFSSSKNA